MSDFLSRLAERALEQAPVVEPLVRSRYDPVHEFVSSHEAVTEPLPERAKGPAAPTLAADSPPPSATPSTVAPQSPAPGRARGTVAPPAVERTRAVAGPKLPPARPERTSDASSRPAAQAVSPQSPRQGAAEPRPPAPRPAAADDALDAGETFAAVPVPARQRRARHVADVSSLPPDSGEAASPRADVARDAVPPERDDALAAVAVPARAHERPPLVPARPAEAMAPRNTRRTQQAQPEPVRVTIGRVEVLAQSPAPPPAPPAATSAPRLSLDEYLRTRGGLER